MSVMSWLMEGDPAIRWQVQRDLAGAAGHEVERERLRVPGGGWGARLLELQGEGGQWGGGAYSPKWTSTTYSLLLLRHLGIPPQHPDVDRATARVRDEVAMGKRSLPFFRYVGETCITGMVLALASYFRPGEEADASVEWLLGQQLPDGGWNCETVRGSRRSSFNTTISVLEGLLEFEKGSRPEASIAEARSRGEEYLLERRLLWSLRTGELINPRWKLISFPPRWHYDVLRALDYLREARAAPDERCREAIDILERKRGADGRWPLQNHHRGQEHFRMEQPRQPSRWNTLRALRVLRWYDRVTGQENLGE